MCKISRINGSKALIFNNNKNLKEYKPNSNTYYS